MIVSDKKYFLDGFSKIKSVFKNGIVVGIVVGRLVYLLVKLLYFLYSSMELLSYLVRCLSGWTSSICIYPLDLDLNL